MTAGGGGRPLSVVFVVRQLSFGGAERQLVALARGLHGRGHRVRVLAFYGGGGLEDGLLQAGVPLTILGKRSRWDLVGPFARAAEVIRVERPEIIHGYLVDANIFSLYFRRQVHGARAVWGVRASGLDWSNYPWAVGALFRLSVPCSRFADLIIANSQSGRRDHISAGYPADRFQVIPNGIDTGVFRPDAAVRAAERTALGYAPEHRVIGLIGRLDPQKGHATFLEAAALMADAAPAARFLCVGNGDESLRARLEMKATALGLGERVRFLPARGDVTATYNALDLLSTASLFGEGFPNVIGEAMACGVRCVVTDTGDSARVVGETGLVVPKGDAAALAEGWLRALEGTLATAPGPRARIEAEFSLERLVMRTEEALLALRERPGRAR